jgi:four helix bundle protein
MAAGVRDLKAWQEAVALGGETLRAVRHSARRETKCATDVLILTAMSIATHIAEGYGRYTAAEQREMYHAAKRDLLRLETQLAVLRQAELLSATAQSDLLKRIHSVTRLLAGYLVYLERQRTTEADESLVQKPATLSTTSPNSTPPSPSAPPPLPPPSAQAGTSSTSAHRAPGESVSN